MNCMVFPKILHIFWELIYGVNFLILHKMDTYTVLTALDYYIHIKTNVDPSFFGPLGCL